MIRHAEEKIEIQNKMYETLNAFAEKVRNPNKEAKWIYLQIHYLDGTIDRVNLQTPNCNLLEVVGALQTASYEIMDKVRGR